VADVEPGGKLSAYHVTDDPEVMARAIERKDLKSHPYAGSLCPGLYVSALPKEWRGRSLKKWDFLKTLKEDDRIYLADLLGTNLRHQRMTGYITQLERDRALEWIQVWLETRNDETLILLAQQPYNIRIQEVVQRNMPVEIWKPYVVKVVFEGRYLEYTDQVRRILPDLAALHLKKPRKDVEMTDVCKTLDDLEWDGLFTTSGPDPFELVLWNPDKIISYGLRQSDPRLSGRLSGRGEGGTIQEGRRFMSSFSPDRNLATIQETAVRTRMFGPMRRDALEELKTTLERLWQGLDPEPGRFKVDLSKELPEIVDTEVYRRIPRVTREDLAELMFLVDEILVEMVP